eukprot:gene17743-9413_t
MELGAIFFCGIFFMFCLSLFRNETSQRNKLPPSQWRLLFLGNAHLLFWSDPHRLFQGISRSLGPIITFWVGRKPIIIVNEINLAKEALIKQDKIFAGRPQRYTGSLYSRNFKGIILDKYGENLKRKKKLAHVAMATFTSESGNMEHIISSECKRFIERLKCKTEGNTAIDISGDIKLTVLNVICSLCFGKHYESHEAEFKQIVQANDWFVEGITCSSIVDSFPLLRYLPLQKMKKLKAFIKIRDDVLEKQFNKHKSMFDGKNPKDLMDHFLNDVEESDKKLSGAVLSNDEQIMLISDLFIAGADTTISTLLWAFLYLAVWPKKQQKLREELDQIVKGRNPMYHDRKSMPYLEATISEVLRLSSLTPLSVPRKTTQPTTLGGYCVPKDTTVVFNMFAMNHDEQIWRDPSNFEPERFLDQDGAYCPLKQKFMPFLADNGCV